MYEYGANSNLVLEADTSSKRREDEGKGEVETLNGKLYGVRMGEGLAGQGKGGARPELSERIEKAKLKRQRDDHTANDEKTKSKKVFFAQSKKGSSILSQTDDLDSLNYRPKTRESRAAYEELLRFTQVVIGDQPHDILKGAADEILSFLKDENLRDSVKQKEIEKITMNMNSDYYYKIVNIGKRINDYRIKEAEAEEDTKEGEEEMEMAVVFDDEEEEDLEQNEEVNEIDENDEDDYREDGVEATGKGHVVTGNKEEEEEIADRYQLAIHDIDAHWLQRQLSKYYTDANISSKLAEDTLSTLQIADERICENKLVVLLDFDKFEFIKMLLKNREKIYYCIKLAQAQTDIERAAVEQDMLADSSGRGAVLLQLIKQKASAESWTQDRIGEFASKARREARALNSKASVQDGALKILGDDDEMGDKALGDERNMLGEKMVNLEDLSFAEGGHMMSNTRCELPDKSWRAQKKGYEEVHVPALRPKISSSEVLVEIADLPEWMHASFLGIRSLNRIQSKMVDAALHASDNILLCAPTGAGKTNVALMCILHELMQHRKEDGTFDLDSFKIVYVAPMKALVQENVQSFGKRLAPYGINVRELSGDQNLTRQQIQDTQVSITTPDMNHTLSPFPPSPPIPPIPPIPHYIPYTPTGHHHHPGEMGHHNT